MSTINKIYGSPGTGKTTKLINIIFDSGLPLEKISYVTFSKRAMEDMKNRMDMKGAGSMQLEWFRTIHSMNFKLLGLRKEQVVTDKKLAEFCTEKKFKLSASIVPTEEISYMDAKMYGTELSADDQYYIQMQKDRIDMRPFNFVHPKMRNFAGAFMHFKHAYFDWMREHDYVDYIGMIEQGIERAVIPPVEMLCVDEWQDLDPLKIKQIMIWASEIPLSYHVGDDDQTIYAFSGADPTSFLQLPCDNEEVLKETFRLPSDILALSQEVIKRNINRKQKDIHTNKEDGGIYFKSVASTSTLLKSLPKDEEVFVLVRNNFAIRRVMKDLATYGIPVGNLHQERKAVRLMLEGYKKAHFGPAEIDTLCNGSVFPALRYFKRGSKTRLKNVLKRIFPDNGYSLKQMEEFGMLPAFFSDMYEKNCSHLNIEADDLTYILRLFDQFGYDFKPVKIMTIHASKGLEADTVILVPDITKACYENEHAKTYDIEAVESERRVWYTAITRAKKRLIMLNRTDYSSYKTRTRDILAIFVERTKKATS